MFREMLSRRSGTEVEKELMREIRAAWIPSFRQTLIELQAEIRRARRYQRPLTVAVLTPEAVVERMDGPSRDGANGGGGIQQHPLARLLFGLLLRDEVRESDIVAYAASQDVYAVIMPETREDEAQLAMGRLSEVSAVRLGYGFRTGTAEFPRDGLTIEDLFEYAARRGVQIEPSEAAPPTLLQEVRNA